MNTIKLDGKMSSLLDFKVARIEALTQIAKGEKVLWELDLGLFKGLSYAFGNETEARSMLLAIDHFVKTLWSEFKNYSSGLVLYRGDLNFDPALFSDYLKFLTLNLTDAIPVFILFESHNENPLDIARKTSRSLYPRFEILVDGKTPPFRSFEEKIGFLLPSRQDLTFKELVEKGVNIRVIDEVYLTSEWDGLDYLLVDPDFMEREVVRKLKGFAAAGGIVVSLGQAIGIPGELKFDREFLIHHL